MPDSTKPPFDESSPRTGGKAPPMIKKAAGPIPAFAQKAATPAPQTPKANPPAAATLTAEERHRRIAEVAYSLAEKRGFQGGSPEQDWLEAAAYVDNQEPGKASFHKSG